MCAIDFLGGEPAARTDPDDPFVRTVVETSEEIYEFAMEIVPMIGGSGPNYPFVHDLGLPVATAGLGHPDTRAHAPNENIRLDSVSQTRAAHGAALEKICRVGEHAKNRRIVLRLPGKVLLSLHSL
jgi:acetylornithine deacetylase/succinyl-diaminopimelate desuccinylase-like protein